ncbi:MarR family transcriptional regulator (plasmid) [Streptomyces anthocyanicus]|nr:MarR family transcriptional regulator [Streptomyces anthocyanicus]
MRDAAEKLALVLAQGGMQKTAARVSTALLFSQQETMTSAELCEELQISAGAVSAAVRQLAPLGLLERVPVPGSRRDHYRFPNGAWGQLMTQQTQLLATMSAFARKGLVAAGGPDSTVGRRLHEMEDFYGFMHRGVRPLIDRWNAEFTANRETGRSLKVHASTPE